MVDYGDQCYKVNMKVITAEVVSPETPFYLFCFPDDLVVAILFDYVNICLIHALC